MPVEPLKLKYATPPTKRASRTRRGANPVAEFIGFSISTIIWSFGACSFIAFSVGALIAVCGGPVGGFPMLLAGVVLIPTLAAAVRSARRRRAAAVLGYVQQAVRLNLPLNRVVAAAARGEKGRTGQRLVALQGFLESGLSLSDAIAEAVPEMSLRSIGLIEYAGESAALGETLDRLVAENVERARRQENEQPFAAWYPPLLIAVVCLCIGTMGRYMVPKLSLIFRDFKLPVPAVFQWIDWLSDWAWLALPVIVLPLLLCLGFQLRKTVRIQNPIWVFRDWRDRLSWRMPLLGGVIQDRQLSDVCLTLADSLRRGYPLELSLDRSQQLDLNVVVRQRIQRWTDALHAGMTPVEAARTARMPKLLVGMMSTARGAGDLSEVLAFVGRFYTDRLLLRRETLRAAAIPVFTLIMGVIVALVALSIFVPLQQLINRLTE